MLTKNKRAVAYGGLALFALIFSIAGTAAPAVTVDISLSYSSYAYVNGTYRSVTVTRSSSETYSLWQGTSTPGCSGCGSSIDATKAFSVMSCLFVFPLFGLAAMDLLGQVPAPLAPNIKLVLAGAAGVEAFWNLLAFAIGVSIPSQFTKAYGSSGVSYTPHAAPFLLMVSMFCSVGAVAVSFILPGPAPVPSAVDTILGGANSYTAAPHLAAPLNSTQAPSRKPPPSDFDL